MSFLYLRAPRLFRVGCGFLLGIPLFSGCGREEAKVYKVPKEKAPPAAVAAPTGWEAAPLGEMRVASFRVKGDDGKTAEVSVIPLPGMAGSDLANVNRWRGQVGLPPVTEGELAKLAQPVEIGGEKTSLYEQAGQGTGAAEKSRILAAITRRDGTAWFFKMTGDDELVAKQKPTFIEYLKSFSFAASGTQPQSAQQELPPSHPPIANPSAAPPTEATGGSALSKPDWQVPAGWREVPGGQMLVAKFMISEGDSQAAVNISLTGGGLAMNVNRWRRQIGLPEQTEDEINQQVTSIDIEGGKGMLIDMSGTDEQTGQKARIVGAIVPRVQQAWFFKLMGPPQIVEQSKAVFVKFVQTTKFH